MAADCLSPLNQVELKDISVNWKQINSMLFSLRIKVVNRVRYINCFCGLSIKLLIIKGVRMPHRDLALRLQKGKWNKTRFCLTQLLT